MDEQFARDVMHGLSAVPKYLSSKYFYDKKGDALFQKIMGLDEYYLTRCEYEIFQSEKRDLLGQFSKNGKPFDLIEFGAGDGKKTKILLDHFLKAGVDFTYLPIDISQNALNILAGDLNHSLPNLTYKTLQGEYFRVLSQLEQQTGRTKVVLFLGSNIGNFLKPVAVDFLSQLAKTLIIGDLLLLGVDLMKDPRVMASAYNDHQGVTKAFNLNLLTRINRELAGDFDLDGFIHFPFYDPVNGAARSLLISNCQQTVSIKRLNATFHFEAWEPIYMELSQKYHIEDLKQLAEQSGFNVIKHYYDSKKYFTDGLWQVSNNDD
jgi:dimethylhistidine N-methyltransferase